MTSKIWKSSCRNSRKPYSSRNTVWNSIYPLYVHMSHITKGSPFRLLSKRKFSMVLNPEFANNTHHQAQNQNLQEDLIQSKHEQLTVNQFVRQTTKSYNFPAFKETSKQYTPLTVENIKIGSQIRDALRQTDNYDKLLSIISNIAETRSFHVITEGLQREEITVLISALVEGQEARIAEYNILKITLDLNEKNEYLGDIIGSSNIITQFYLGLLARKFELSSTELYLLLKLESNNYRYDRAADLIQYIDKRTSGIPKSSKYWNYKLKVLGDANPGNWSVLNKEQNRIKLSKRAVKQDFEKMLSFGVLMNQLSTEIGSMVPNLETHGLIITSAGRDNQLELIASQVENLWGIGPDSISYDNLVDPNSSIYPNTDLLRNIVAAFAVNHQLEIGIKYITNFQAAYNIDMSKGLFWKELFNWAEATLEKDDPGYFNIIESISKLMESNTSGTNVILANKRSQFLEEQGRLKDLVNLTMQNRKEVAKYFEPLKLSRGKVLLKNMYQKICSVAFAQNQEDSIDLVMLYGRLALDKSSEIELKKIYEEELKKADEERRRFQVLQEEYDEEDDENSLW